MPFLRKIISIQARVVNRFARKTVQSKILGHLGERQNSRNSGLQEAMRREGGEGGEPAEAAGVQEERRAGAKTK
jgi:hypothetical protein